jgi:NADPH2:quinone reductase
MRAILMTAVGGPEVLKLTDLPEPEIAGEHDVRVRLRAAGVNPVDTKLRARGTIGGHLPAVLGWDGAGVAGQRVLVQAGAGGVGHMSVQIARLAGARVATTVSPGPKTELAAELGAELCIDYTHEDVGAKLRGWTGTDGADVVHDTVGGKTFTACFSLTRPYGDLVSNVESPWKEEAIAAMHDRNLRVSFTWMPAPSVFGWPEQRERQRTILEQAAKHFEAGELRVEVGATFPLDRAADAHRAVEAGQVIGKTVLTMG